MNLCQTPPPPSLKFVSVGTTREPGVISLDRGLNLIRPGGGEGTPIYWLYGYVPLERVMS